MSESRVRENRSHGSMRRREATPASRPARAAPEASRRPYAGALDDGQLGGRSLRNAEALRLRRSPLLAGGSGSALRTRTTLACRPSERSKHEFGDARLRSRKQERVARARDE